jgi:hypothetical protein
MNFISEFVMMDFLTWWWGDGLACCQDFTVYWVCVWRDRTTSSGNRTGPNFRCLILLLVEALTIQLIMPSQEDI